MSKTTSMYDLKIYGTIYEQGEEMEVVFIPNEEQKEQYEKDLEILLSKYETGILVN